MLGLIAKVLLFCVVVVAGIVIALNQTGAATWGTVSLRTPAIEPCHRFAETLRDKPLLVEVRWSWVQHKYGWGCHYEFGDDSKRNIPYGQIVGSSD